MARRPALSTALGAMLVLSGGAFAQSADPGTGETLTTKTGGGTGADGDGATSGRSGGAATTDLVSPGQGGVGGTGLGKMPPGGDATGTGMSVKGPPGQGIKTDAGTSP